MRDAKQPGGLDRRDFLRGVAAAAVSAGLIGNSEAQVLLAPPGRPGLPLALPDELQPHPVIRAAPHSEGFWNQVRKAFVLPPDYIHMNTGTTGSQPLFSLVNLGVYNLYKSLDPRDWERNLNADFPDLFPLGVCCSAPRRSPPARRRWPRPTAPTPTRSCSPTTPPTPAT
jgi:hypothetical protein